MILKQPTRCILFAHAHEDYPALDDITWNVHSLAYVDSATVLMSARPTELKPLTLQKDSGIDLKKIVPKTWVN